MHLSRWLPAICILMLTGCLGGLAPGAIAPTDIPDPTTLTRTGWPNDWLICPARACRAEASATAPSFSASPDELFAAWRAVVATQPRVTVIAVDDTRLLLMAQDRTPLLRFVDTITIRVLPAPGARSTFAAYSRSNLGLGDFSTNRHRLEEWLAAVDRELSM